MLRKKVSEYLFLLALGGTLYYTIELLYRGFSHWSMFLLGGICFSFFWWQGSCMHWREPIWKQVLRASIFVTSCEFLTGMIVNKWLQLAVWDYSNMPYNVFGQICLSFAVLFSGLCFLGILLSGVVMQLLFREEKMQMHWKG